MSKKGMGGALLGQLQGSDVESVLSGTEGHGVQSVPVGKIEPSPYQPRRAFGKAELKALAESVREQGILQPLIVRPKGKGWELVAGERRLRAALLAGLSTVPALVRDLSDMEAAAATVAENLARKDLTPWEEAQALATLRDTLKVAGRKATVRELASLTGRALGSVAESLKIADRLTDPVRRGAETNVQSMNSLPKTALHGAAQGSTDKARAEILKASIGSATPGKAAQAAQAARVKRKPGPHPGKAYSLTVPKSGKVELLLRRPVEEMEQGEAAELLDRLSGFLAALKKRAGTPARGKR